MKYSFILYNAVFLRVNEKDFELYIICIYDTNLYYSFTYSLQYINYCILYSVIICVCILLLLLLCIMFNVNLSFSNIDETNAV
jgi:hypothetical protein